MFDALWDQVKNGFAPQPGWRSIAGFGPMLPLHVRENETAQPVMGTDESGRMQSFTQPRFALGMPEAISSPLHSVMNSSQKLSQGQTPTVEDYMPALSAFAGGGIATAAERPNSMGVFGGQIGAQRMGRAPDLAKAMSMHSQGHTPEEIYQATGGFDPTGTSGGFWMGGDNKWRFELPDTQSKLLNTPNWESQMLPSVLEHPTLYKAYPELTDVQVRNSFGTAFGGAQYGKNNKGDRFILTHAEPEDLKGGMISKKSEVLHEAQHGIQDVEGFSRGGTPEEFPQPPKDFGAFREFLRSRRDAAWRGYQDHIDMMGYGNHSGRYDSPKFHAYEQAQNDASRVGDMINTPIDLYRNLAGESEARNVQQRLAAQVGGPPTEGQRWDWGRQSSPHVQLDKPWLTDRDPPLQTHLRQGEALPAQDVGSLYDLPPELKSLYEEFQTTQKPKVTGMGPAAPLGFQASLPPNNWRVTGNRPANEHAADMAALEEAVRRQVLDVQHPSPTVRKALQKKGK